MIAILVHLPYISQIEHIFQLSFPHSGRRSSRELPAPLQIVNLSANCQRNSEPPIRRQTTNPVARREPLKYSTTPYQTTIIHKKLMDETRTFLKRLYQEVDDAVEGSTEEEALRNLDMEACTARTQKYDQYVSRYRSIIS
ncbi:hypothetical protein HBI79_100450 [Parastagonospora nodorum]|nr:hypothetical protein HBI79_100450 [Parastagonospora nodorum]